MDQDTATTDKEYASTNANRHPGSHSHEYARPSDTDAAIWRRSGWTRRANSYPDNNTDDD